MEQQRSRLRFVHALGAVSVPSVRPVAAGCLAHGLEAVSRFVDVTTGNRRYLYTLDPLGVVVCPTNFNDPDRPGAGTPRSSVEHIRIVGSPELAHLLGTNELFIDLIGYAGTDPAARLAPWWSEPLGPRYPVLLRVPGRRPNALGCARPFGLGLVGRCCGTGGLALSDLGQPVQAGGHVLAEVGAEVANSEQQTQGQVQARWD